MSDDETTAVVRLVQLLGVIPRTAPGKTAQELHEQLEARGATMDVRTVQRNLVKLRRVFPLRTTGKRPIRWSLGSGTGTFTSSAPDSADALALAMIRQFLEPVMPPALLRTWKSQFADAKRVLDASKFRRWRDRVAILPAGPSRLPVKIAPEVVDVVYGALLSSTQFEADYHPVGRAWRHYAFHPLALVYRDGVTYLVAGCEDLKFVPIFALHRMRNPRPSERPVQEPAGFDLQLYIKGQQGFEWPVGPAMRLRLRLDCGIAPYFTERPLSTDQTVTPIRASDDLRLTATVQNTLPLRWWLLSFGPAVEVLAPKAIRDDMADMLASASRQYRRRRR